MPYLLIDGDCAFCMRSANWARRRVRPSVDLVPWQSVDIEALGVSAEQCMSAVQWVSDGVVTASGGRAVCLTLATAPPPWPTLSRLMSLPGTAAIVDQVYRWVAKNRMRLPGGTPQCAMPESEASLRG